MELKIIEGDFSVCKIKNADLVDLSLPFTFLSVTDEEISLVCKTENVPEAAEREDGWRMLRIEGQLDFSLVGILSRISRILANEKIGIFAVSTFNTDYILCKKSDFDRAVNALISEGYAF